MAFSNTRPRKVCKADTGDDALGDDSRNPAFPRKHPRGYHGKCRDEWNENEQIDCFRGKVGLLLLSEKHRSVGWSSLQRQRCQSSQRLLSSGNVKARLSRASSRFLIGRGNEIAQTSQRSRSKGQTSSMYRLVETSHTSPARLPSGAITNASPESQGSRSKSVKPSTYTSSRTTNPCYTGDPSGRATNAGSVRDALSQQDQSPAVDPSPDRVRTCRNHALVKRPNQQATGKSPASPWPLGIALS